MNDVTSLVSSHNEWRLEKCINLQPSENVTSKEVRQILSSDMGHRYTLPINQEVHGSFVENAYRGTRYIDEIETIGESLAREIFSAKYATLKPLSGHIAGMIMLLATCKKGDRILVIDAKHGGYDGYLQEGMPDMFGLKVDHLPFDETKWNVDSDKAVKKIIEYRPRLIVFGASFILFPYEIATIREVAEKVGASIGYDGSHVLGLIAGGVFQNPLKEGVDILTGSTHKTFFGPQGGLLMCRDEELAERVNENFFWRVMDNAHWNRIAALTQALKEVKRYGSEYARQVVKNAKKLAAELDQQGIPMKYPNLGYTECHQIHVEESGLKKLWNLTLNEFAVKLERCDLIVDAMGRIGSNEVTRYGASEADMFYIANLMIKALRGENVKGEVNVLRSKMKINYCFE